VITGVRRSVLRVWGRVPRLARRWIVRLLAPSFTLGAACVIERGDGSILLVRLVYREAWGLPGGLIKRNEDVATCARREVAEEIGLPVELVGSPAVVVDSRPQRVDVVFRARPAAGSDPADVRAASVEIREVAWFPAHDLPRLQHEAVTALVALASRTGDGADGVVGGGTGDAADRSSPGPPADVASGSALQLAAEQAAEQAAVSRRALAS
jgi:8-oxo-dGTP diphosphatase